MDIIDLIKNFLLKHISNKLIWVIFEMLLLGVYYIFVLLDLLIRPLPHELEGHLLLKSISLQIVLVNLYVCQYLGVTKLIIIQQLLLYFYLLNEGLLMHLKLNSTLLIEFL